jgi:phytoene desaturase
MQGARSVAVIGAGVGGLTVAARLALAGHRVTVFEKNAGPGGRCGVVRDGGFTWDLGPTILLMRDVIEGVFRDAGRDPADYLTLTRCDPNYRIHYADGTSITFSPALGEMRDELERVEPGSFGKFLKFLENSRGHYDTSVAALVGRPLDGVANYLRPSILKAVLSVRAYRKLSPWLAGFFADPRLQMALSFQTMYLGLSPYEAPATYSLLPYTELAMGIWYPRGGLYAVPLAIEKLGRELGVTYRYDAPIERIVTGEGRAKGVRLAGGREEAFDVVVANADLPYAYDSLVPEARPKRADSFRYTSSAFMLYLGVEGACDHLEHHNVVFGSRYRETFQEIFHDRVIPREPAVYVNRPTATDPSLAPVGADALYVLVPVPHQTEHVDWESAAPRLREQVLDLMETRLSLPGLRGRIRIEHQVTPDDWASRFNLAKGAAFGLAHDFRQVGALRPSTRDETFRNLYFVGASTQPGTGVPLVMLSAKIVAERIARELPELPSGAPLPAPAALRDVA